MYRFILKSKIHRATVTDANLDYEGSVSIDKFLMECANIVQYEQVEIYNITNGERFSTYAIEGKRNTGEICINGAAAHKARKGDLIIIATYTMINDSNVVINPEIVKVDKDNFIKGCL